MSAFAYTFDWGTAFENLGYILEGLTITILLTVLSMLAALVLGLVTALARLSSFRVVRAVSYAYVEFFRTVPLLLALFWIYYALPVLTGARLSAFLAAFLAFALNLSAYCSEIFRAGFIGVSAGQRAAALSLGMSRSQVMRRIVVPQAVRRVIPPMGNVWVSLFKDTSLVFAIGLGDLTFRAQEAAINTYRPFEIYTLVAVVYLLLSWPQARAVDWLFERSRVRG